VRVDVSSRWFEDSSGRRERSGVLLRVLEGMLLSVLVDHERSEVMGARLWKKQPVKVVTCYHPHYLLGQFSSRSLMTIREKTSTPIRWKGTFSDEKSWASYLVSTCSLLASWFPVLQQDDWDNLELKIVHCKYARTRHADWREKKKINTSRV